MTTRYEDVGEAHPETFEWAFTAPKEEHSWSDLSRWLKEGEGVYWVSGKAGSGKSTFMKHLVNDDQKRLHNSLNVWARDSKLCIATFFFWNSETRLQRSQLGFLRTLLFHVLDKHQGLVPIVFPRAWSMLYSDAIAEVSTGRESYALRADCQLSWEWGLKELKEGLRNLGCQTLIPLKICFIIDGLDELNDEDGDHEEMGKLFSEITTSKLIKVCTSSRPWVVFEDLFEHQPKLKLQSLTYRDIEIYVHGKFYSNTAFLKLREKEPEGVSTLLREVVGKADGVFLWVKIVVRLLLKGIRNRDDLAELWDQFRRLPRELKPLYNHLLELIEPYKEWASQAIQILRCNRELCNDDSVARFPASVKTNPITISEFSLAMRRDTDLPAIETITRKEFQLMAEDTRIRLTARCAGLLEVSNIPGSFDMGPGSLIQYFHRTAKDFLETPEVWARLLLETEKTRFDPRLALMGSYLRYMKVQIAFFVELAKERDGFEPVDLESFGIPYEVEVNKQIGGFLTCAFQADLHAPSRRKQMPLIRQLEELITKYDPMGNWLLEMLISPEGVTVSKVGQFWVSKVM